MSINLHRMLRSALSHQNRKCDFYYTHLHKKRCCELYAINNICRIGLPIIKCIPPIGKSCCEVGGDVILHCGGNSLANRKRL
jgi:hypothetical protein